MPMTKAPVKRSATALAAVLALSYGGLETWEGVETRAYWDSLGSVWTVCLGETRGVKRGDSYTEAQCKTMAESGLKAQVAVLDACIPTLPAAPVEVQAATMVWAWNVGTGAACGSTLARNLRAGDYRAACNQLPIWNIAGGKVVPGLINRRTWERALCLSGIKEN